MLGRKRKTWKQQAQEATKMVVSTAGLIGKKHRSLTLKYVCIACIVIFSFSIGFGIYGLVSRMNDISKRGKHIEALKNELQYIEEQYAIKQKLRNDLINDPLTIEATARSYGMSKKGEHVFYFLD